MSRTSRLAAHGISIDLPRGWDGEIRQADHPGETELHLPVLHATNVALPRERGDFGSGAVETIGRGGVLLAILEYDPASAGTPLFDHPFPTRLRVREFGTNKLQRALRGQAGTQRFVTHGGRAFCVYAVIGSFRARELLVPEINKALGTVEIDPRT